jgi:hypothetical protein
MLLRSHRTAQAKRYITPRRISMGPHQYEYATEVAKVGYSGLAKRLCRSASCRALERPLMQHAIRTLRWPIIASSDCIQPLPLALASQTTVPRSVLPIYPGSVFCFDGWLLSVISRVLPSVLSVSI